MSRLKCVALSVTVSLSGCAVDQSVHSSGTGKQGGYSLLHHDEHNQGLVNDDNAPRTPSTQEERETVIDVCGFPYHIWPNTAYIEFKTNEDADRFFNDFNATSLYQVKVRQEILTGLDSYNEGDEDPNNDAVSQAENCPLDPLPKHLVKFNDTTPPRLQDLQSLGEQIGLLGEFSYYSNTTATTAFNILKAAALSTNYNIELITFNPMGQPSTHARTLNVTEGPWMGDPSNVSLSSAPYSKYFWWTSPLNYWAGNENTPPYARKIYNGANLLNPEANASIAAISTGSKINVAVIDSGFRVSKSNKFFGDEDEVYFRKPLTFNAATGGTDIDGVDSSGFRYDKIGASGHMHGRAVSSLIFARPNSGTGTFGIASGANPMLANVDFGSPLFIAQLVNSIDWAAKNKARV